MKSVYINKVSAFLPNEPITNDEMESVLGQVGARPSRARKMILRSNGIVSRHYAIDRVTGAPNFSNAQLAAEAVRGLAGVDFSLETLDCLACASSIPDQLMPGHGVMVHGELASPPCEVVSTAGVCLAGVAALKYCWMSVMSGQSQHAVAAASENASASMRAENFKAEVDAKIDALEKQPEIAFEKDFLRWMLSDGAGAMLLEPAPRAGGVSLKIEWIDLFSYANEQAACMYAGAEKDAQGTLIGWGSMSAEQRQALSVFSVKQDVKQLNEHIIHYTVERPMRELVEKYQLSAEQIDYFVPHYSSGYFRDKVASGMAAAGLDIPMTRWFTNLSSKGNTGSASIYIMLEELLRTQPLRQGAQILCYIPESGRFSTGFMLLTVEQGI